MGVSCVYESYTNHRPQSREAQNFGLYQKFDPGVPGISRAQTTPLSAAAPSLHRFLDQIPEPQIRVPNSAHLLLIAGISSFSFPRLTIFCYLYRGDRNLALNLPRLAFLVSIEAGRTSA